MYYLDDLVLGALGYGLDELATLPNDDEVHDDMSIGLEIVSITDRRRGPFCSTRYVKQNEVPETITGRQTAAEALEIVSLTERRRGPSRVAHPVKDDEIPTTITGVPMPTSSNEDKENYTCSPAFLYEFGDLTTSFSVSFVSRPLSPLSWNPTRKSIDTIYTPPTSPLASFSNLCLDAFEYRRPTPPSSPRRVLHRTPTTLSVQ